MADFGKKDDAPAAMTMTLTSLGSGSGRESTAIDDSATLAVDRLITVKSNGSAAGNTGLVDFYVYALHQGTAYTDGATGTDAAFTAANRLNSRYLGSLQMNGTTSVTGSPWSVAEAFGGILPSKWGIIAINNSGAALSATGADHEVYQTAIYGTTT